jgi:hypothetical protein
LPNASSHIACEITATSGASGVAPCTVAGNFDPRTGGSPMTSK